ncbi:hypothetical protein BS47DRAFT_1396689 [Hydnum rufescens UP504]|uniref:Class E vacuolar protein-sorting machinery protein HSE1 n=1 Tax=Hydnum rufescens UP504 TaxID=1448309 RepID=A0A9P6ARP6_9AGAM|nr:hypothetical protein BS47DRAFT_1396689 [Hydnum rufescens UP504]
MFKAVNPYDEIVAKATDENLTAENWEVIISLCDKVQEEGETGARNVIAAILKRLAHRTSNVQLYALSLAEALSKNCGIELHRELSSRSFTQGLEKLVGDRNTHEKVKRRTLNLIRTWAGEFESDPTLGIMGECYESLKGKNYKFEPENEPPPPEVDDEIRRKEEEELQRVLELSMKDRGGRSNWVSKYPDQGGSSSIAASSSQPTRSNAASSSKPGTTYPSGFSPSPNAAVPTHPRSSTIRTAVPSTDPSLAKHSSPIQPTRVSSAAPTSIPASIPAPAQPVSAPPASSPSPVQISRVRALHTFEPTEPGELGFEKGDVIKVVDRGYKDWWRGQLRGKTGIFPVNYVVGRMTVCLNVRINDSLSFIQEPIAEPTPAEIAREAQQEAQIFAQAAAIDQLLEMLRKVDPLKDNIADNEEIQELYRSSMTLRPKIVKLIDRYSQKRADLVAMNESFVKARRIFDQVMEESLAKHNPGAALYDYTRVPEQRPDSHSHPVTGYASSPGYGWTPGAYGPQQQGVQPQFPQFDGARPTNYPSQEPQQPLPHSYSVPPQVSPSLYATNDPAVYQQQLQQQQFQQMKMQQQPIPAQNPQVQQHQYQPAQQQQLPSPGYTAPPEPPHKQQQGHPDPGVGYRPPASPVPTQSGFVQPVQSPQPQQTSPVSPQIQPQAEPQGQPVGQAQAHAQNIQQPYEQVPSQAHLQQQSQPAQGLPNPQVVAPLPPIDGPLPYPFDASRQYADPNVQAWASYYASGGNDPTGRVYFIPSTLPASALLSPGDAVSTHHLTRSQSQQSQPGPHSGTQTQQLEHEVQPQNDVTQGYTYGSNSRPVQQDPGSAVSSPLSQVGLVGQQTPDRFRRSEPPQARIQGYHPMSLAR